MSMSTILRILLEITVYSVVLFAAVMLFKRLFRRHISPILGYAVWALLILRLMIPVTFNSDVKLFVIPETALQTAQIQSAAAPNQEVAADTAQAADSAAPLYNDSANPVSYEQPMTRADEVPMVNESSAADIKPVYSKPISWQKALVMLWAAGAAISAGVLLLLSRRIKKRTSKGSPAPDVILQIVDACKRDMRIRADINVLVQDWLSTPALTASLKPRLLLPESMLNGMDIRQIEYGIRHELMHYRRRDYLAALLLMLLRCVYWFNPVVWLASKQIETDMEAACDASVTADFNKPERLDYAQTMIDLGSKANAYLLGMGVSNSRASMEKRVRGIFMDKRSKLPVRLAALVLSGLLIFTCFTTACQPIKAQSVDNAAAVEEETASAAEPEPSPVIEPEVNPNEGYGNFPDWVETYTQPNLKVDINAQIVTPQTDVFPVYKVKQRRFDNETLKRMLNYFADDIVGVRESSQTKEELQELLGYMYEHDAKNKDEIKDLKAQIAAAKPEVFTPVDENTVLPGSLIFQRADGSRINFSAYKNSCYIDKYTGNYGLQLEEWVRTGGWPHLLKFMDKTLEASKLTEKEAISQAEKALVDMGIEDMSLVRTDRAVIVNTCLDAFPSAGWYVSFGRTDNGSVPADMSLQDSIYFDFREDDYFERWWPERLSIYVDDAGIQSISWDHATVVTDVEQENVTLLPWDKAQQAIRDAMALGWSKIVGRRSEYDQEYNQEEYVTNIIIDKAILTNVLVPQGDNLDYQLMVPAWVVYNHNVWEYNGKKGEGSTMIIAVNATDGSVIDLTFRTHEMEKRAEARQEKQEQEEAAKVAAE